MRKLFYLRFEIIGWVDYMIKTNIGVLDRTVQILDAFDRDNVELSPQEISEKTNIPLPTVYRLVVAMTEHDLLEKIDRKYKLGIAIMSLGIRVAESTDIRKLALPYMKELNAAIDENINLVLRHKESRMTIETVESLRNPGPFTLAGEMLPLHRGASGRVLLAWLPDADCLSAIQASVSRYAEYGPVDYDEFFQDLRRVRAQGYAFTVGDRNASLASLAVPIFSRSMRPIAAVAIVAPSARLNSGDILTHLPILKSVAGKISYSLGYIGIETAALFEGP